MAAVGIMPSPTNGLSSAFSPYTDSPNSPAPYKNNFIPASNRSSGPSDSLAPPPSPYPQTTDPSPVDSNGTESTEIEEEAQEDGKVKSPSSATNGEVHSPDIEITSPESTDNDRLHMIDTQVSKLSRSGSEDGPSSVIHAPSSLKKLKDGGSEPHSPTEGSENTVVSPDTPEAVRSPKEKKLAAMSPVNTDVPRANDRSTPHAQTRQEVEEDWKRRSWRTSPLEDIAEAADNDNDNEEADGPDTAGLVGDGTLGQAMQASLHNAEEEVAALRTALSECWTLCNTLAALSSTHRQRTFKSAGKQDIQESAWRSCWRLCQQLYDSRDEDHASQVLPTLELCRDFCQSLFEARQKTDEASDSVLRVSFELNNHLYNTKDRSLPEAFNERTLDFYITMCHRLMKQRTSLPQETDALLRACWSLAEMLFNLRQNKREGKQSDEELLGSAVQSCWELCDLFREGWTQIRPERGTPRPSQIIFQNTFPRQTSHKSTSSQSDAARSTSSLSNRQYHDAPSVAPLVPETPTTIFDDGNSTTSSPESVDNVPNILVLGPAAASTLSLANGGASSLRLGGGSNKNNNNGGVGGGGGGAPHHERWSSNASVLSGYSESAAGSTASSQRSTSTATASAAASTSAASTEEAHLARLRYLLLKAGMHVGYTRTSHSPLPTHVTLLPANAFGSLPWQMKVLELYKKLVLGDRSMMGVHSLPARRLGAVEVAKSVKWLGAAEQWAWMRDLYRLVLGFGIEDAERRGGAISV
ncbi:hypothetical protein LTR02_012716 [Friedmanniomyces endolithicus]|nr:hypothetical protein LTR94_016918 [Friedmanniomyces endolithicus]KAK0783063.1 hypothetical protein LTR38_013171 [Friedmanniomyces endolithicus]KAK0788853.1 hypothetical protein LTR59_009869 [Friedmanniomyces endolithicus]KAK0844819.1 hypothetical protein LTR03_007814 [Friedmanniomyces endolithicus]KAK0893654.1 hypothetical protein LTR02_012716 [Friedmanniomyces endolithicus]